MSGNQIYEFHQRELADLKTARVFTLGICGWIKRLQEGVVNDDPSCAARAVHEFLDFNNCRESCLSPVDHLLTPVSQPSEIPGFRVIRGRSVDAKRDVLQFQLAHRAAWRLHYFLHNHLWAFWGKRHQGYFGQQEYAYGACNELVGSYWQVLRNELKFIVEYDCEGLTQAVEKESAAAMERCRQSIVFGTVVARLEPDNSSDPSDSTSSVEKNDKALKKELLSALQKHGIRLEVAETLSPEQKRNIIMAYWGETPAKIRDRWLVKKWKPCLGMEGKTQLADKVKQYIQRGKKKLDELASEK